MSTDNTQTPAAPPQPPPQAPAQAASPWEALKAKYQERLDELGFDRDIPEPGDKAEFPLFLRDLHAKDASLAHTFIKDVRGLNRTGATLPNTQAARKREQKRQVKQFLFFRKVGDAWVIDKRKAPWYGLGTLLLVSSVLTGIYALPRLAGKPIISGQTQGTEAGAGETAQAGQADKPTASTEHEELLRAREELARLKKQLAKPGPDLTPVVKNGAGQGTQTTATNSLKPLGSRGADTPPAPPKVEPPARQVSVPEQRTPQIDWSAVPAAAPAPAPAVTTPQRAVVVATPAEPPIVTPPRVDPTPLRSVQVVQPAPQPVARSVPQPSARPAPVPAPQSSSTFGGGDEVEAASSPFGGTGDMAAPAPAAQPAVADLSGITSGMVYEKAPSGADGSGAQGDGTLAQVAAAEQPFGSDALNPASKIGATGPFKPLQQVPARLLTAFTTLAGGSVPVVAVTSDGGAFYGVGTLNMQLARVDLKFRRYIAPSGEISAVDALAYTAEGANLAQGVPATIKPVAPTLALDAAQNSVNSLNTYLQTLINAAANARGGTQIITGDNATVSTPSLPSLAATIAGGLGSTFKLPENTQSVSRIGAVNSNVPMVVLIGVGEGQ